MTFTVDFEGQPLAVPCSTDHAESVQFQRYRANDPYLTPLLTGAQDSKRSVTQLRQSQVVSLWPGDTANLDIRCYMDMTENGI